MAALAIAPWRAMAWASLQRRWPRIQWMQGLLSGVLWGIAVATLESLGSPLLSACDVDGVVFATFLVFMWTTRGAVLAWTALALGHRRWGWWMALLFVLEAGLLSLAWDGQDAVTFFSEQLLGITLPARANFLYTFGVLLIYGSPFVWFCLIGQRERRARDILARAEIERSRTAAMLNEARLEAVKGSVDPALLLRALSTVRDLYPGARARAESLLDAFVAFLRHAMPGVRTGRSSIVAELALLRAYAQLMQQLEPVQTPLCRVQADAPPRDLPFPALLMLPLVDRLRACQGASASPIQVELTAEAACMKLSFDAPAAHDGWLADDLTRRLQRMLQAVYGNEWRWSAGRSPSLTLWLPLLPKAEENCDER